MLIDEIPTFAYFYPYVTINSDSKILDFGSNWGNYINSSNLLIDQKNYTALDVDKEALEVGKYIFPRATWIHYNRYNPVYNPTGDNQFPKFDHTFDVVVSYSVFSHMSIEDTLETLDFLYDQLNPGGKICFSYCNIDNPICVEWFRNRRENCDPVSSQDYVYLINNRTSLQSPTEPVTHFVSFYKTEWLLNKLSKYNAVSEPPHAVWFQDTIIITK